MSSNTTYDVAPPPEPPPTFTHDERRVSAISTSAVLGPGGAQMIRETLARLAGPGDWLGRQVKSGVDPADPGLDDLRGWRQDAANRCRFVRTTDVRVGEEGIRREIVVFANEALVVEDTFTLTKAGSAVTDADLQKVRAAGRILNSVLAVAVTERIEAKLKERLPQRLKATVRQKQTVAVAPSGQRTVRGQVFAYGEHFG